MSQTQNNEDLVYELLGWVTVTEVTYLIQIHVHKLKCISLRSKLIFNFFFFYYLQVERCLN